jgi:shikimate kinase
VRGAVIVFICGFMGSGKTTFLKELKLQDSNSSENIFLDLDQEIYLREGQQYDDLADLIKNYGWARFRELELEILTSLVQESQKIKNDVFISLGGGAVTDEFLRLKNDLNNCFLVWLDTPLETCIERIEGNSSRPLAEKGPKYLKKLYSEREKYYQKADTCLDASSRDMVWTVRSLKETLLS